MAGLFASPMFNNQNQMPGSPNGMMDQNDPWSHQHGNFGGLQTQQGDQMDMMRHGGLFGMPQGQQTSILGAPQQQSPFNWGQGANPDPMHMQPFEQPWGANPQGGGIGGSLEQMFSKWGSAGGQGGGWGGQWR